MLAIGNVRDFETRFRKKDGGIVRVSSPDISAPTPRPGISTFRAMFCDITRQRELEEQLSHSHRMEAVGRLAGGVAHDFNNITQSISLSCELALQSQLAPALSPSCWTSCSRPRVPPRSPVNCSPSAGAKYSSPASSTSTIVFAEALPMLTRAVGVDVSIELKLDETIDHIFVDPEQLSLVLMHLADNARNRHARRWTVANLHRRTPQLQPRTQTTQPCAVLTVSDTGIGMSEKTLGHIFEPFFSTKNITVASGLGLSTVHGIISQSRGRIECQSSLGHGTTFRIYLPVAARRHAATPAICTSESNGFRILLAEDDPAVNKHLTHSLRKAGFSVDSVGNGEEALTNFGRHTYHLVVTDILMPKLGGIELTRHLRQFVPSLPVVLISGSNIEESILQHFPNDRTAYLQKPFSSSQLVTTVHNLLSGTEAKQQT